MIWTGSVGETTNQAGTATAAGKTGSSTLTVAKIAADSHVTCSIGEANAHIALDIYG